MYLAQNSFGGFVQRGEHVLVFFLATTILEPAGFKSTVTSLSRAVTIGETTSL